MLKTLGELRGILDGIKWLGDDTPLRFSINEKGSLEKIPCKFDGFSVDERKVDGKVVKYPDGGELEIHLEMAPMSRTINFKVGIDRFQAKPDDVLVIYFPEGFRLNETEDLAKQIGKMADDLHLRVFMVPNTTKLDMLGDEELAKMGLQRIGQDAS